MSSVRTTRIGDSYDPTVLMPEIWSKQVGLAATDRRVLAALVERVPFGGPGDVMNFQFINDIAVVQTGAAQAQQGPTYAEVNPTQRQVTPLAANAAVEIDRDLMKRWLPATEDAIQKRLGISLGNQVEVDIATEMVDTAEGFADATDGNGVIGTDADAIGLPNLLTAVGTVWKGGKDLITQGQDRLYGVFHSGAWADLMEAGLTATQGSFLSAAVRGEANGPARTGRIVTTFGMEVDFTGHIIEEGASGAKNVIFAEGSTILSMKEDPEILIQPYELRQRVIAVIDYGVLVMWQNLGIEYDSLIT